MKTLDELRKMDKEKLLKELADTEKELFKIKFDLENEQSKNSHLIRRNRRQKARIKTLITPNNFFMMVFSFISSMGVFVET